MKKLLFGSREFSKYNENADHLYYDGSQDIYFLNGKPLTEDDIKSFSDVTSLAMELSVDFMPYYLLYQHAITAFENKDVDIIHPVYPGLETPFWELFKSISNVSEVIQGYLSLGDISAIINLALEQVAKGESVRALEIGSWLGLSSHFIAKSITYYNQESKLYCVDTWGDVSGVAPRGSYADYVDVLHQFRSLSKGFGTFPHIRTMAMKSHEALAVLEDDMFDFAFIDADHRYNATIYEILYTIKKLKVGGVILGHDYRHYDGKFPSIDKEVIEKHKNDHVTLIEGREYQFGVIAAVDEVFGSTVSLAPKSSVWYKLITEEDKERAEQLIIALDVDLVSGK